MKLVTIDQFLTKGSGQIASAGEDFVAAGIHCSSEVESCTIGGFKLGVKSLVPITPGSAQQALADRISANQSGQMTGFNACLDGQQYPGEKLVLALYESCDGLQPPGPRAPYLTRAAATALPTTAAGAQPVCRLPMSGRTRAALWWAAQNNTCTIVVSGYRANFGVAKGYFHVVNTTLYTTPDQTGVAGFEAGVTDRHRAVYIDNESFDDLLVWAFDSAGGSISFFAEVTGERL